MAVAYSANPATADKLTVARRNWDTTRRQRPVRLHGPEPARAPAWARDASHREPPPWQAIGPDLEIPLCPGVVRWSMRPRDRVLSVEWEPERGESQRIFRDRAEYLLHELTRSGLKLVPVGASRVGQGQFEVSRGREPGVGATWSVSRDEASLWWVKVAKSRMPLDALIWRMCFSHEDEK